MGSAEVGPTHTAKAVYRVRGMTCGSCVAHVKRALLAVPGVKRATVDLMSNTAMVGFDPALATPGDLFVAVSRVGYSLLPLTPDTETLDEHSRDSAEGWVGSALLGAGAAAVLLSLYLAVAVLAQGWEHALSLFREDAVFVVAITIGFGLQVSMFARLRALHSRASGRTLAATGGTSTATMLACCVHHLADVAPIVGLTGVATLLGAYKVPLLWFGVLANLGGLAYLGRELHRYARHN
ncbi:MAG: heavy-metal-associated domain-containing protein [Chloroflexota bacterium]